MNFTDTYQKFLTDFTGQRIVITDENQLKDICMQISCKKLNSLNNDDMFERMNKINSELIKFNKYNSNFKIKLEIIKKEDSLECMRNSCNFPYNKMENKTDLIFSIYLNDFTKLVTIKTSNEELLEPCFMLTKLNCEILETKNEIDKIFSQNCIKDSKLNLIKMNLDKKNLRNFDNIYLDTQYDYSKLISYLKIEMPFIAEELKSLRNKMFKINIDILKLLNEANENNEIIVTKMFNI